MTIGDHINSVAYSKRAVDLLDWPPDVFAVSASLLKHSGGYCSAVSTNWTKPRGRDVAHKMRVLGRKWRDAIARGKGVIEVENLLKSVYAHRSVQLAKLCGDPRLVATILDLIGIADEACVNVANPSAEDHPFLSAVYEHLSHNPRSLCRWVDPTILRVLPKVHTPQSGMTLRSLTHYLAVVDSSEVDAAWHALDESLVSSGPSPVLNILTIPYPYETAAGEFKDAGVKWCGRAALPEKFGYFSYVPPDATPWIEKDLPGLLDTAFRAEPNINGVAFPEAAFSNESQFRLAYTRVRARFPHAFLLAGVCDAAPGRPKNTLRYAIPVTGSKEDLAIVFDQSKHHRWKLDRPQIMRYGLPLDRERLWWEHIDISQRTINFFSTPTWHTFCFLICEDLARQEPVAPLVRAIGPHLIIALLQDGEQLADRWPARYATVLSDDPGSAVLTLTSAGMAKLGKTSSDKYPLSIGLWQDQLKRQVITVAPGDKAVILRIRSDQRVEYSADSRRNEGGFALTLDKVDPIG